MTPSLTSPINSESEEEIKVLKTMVHRLNAELSKYQNSSENNSENRESNLPKIESCLNMQQLAPLVVAYEEEVKEKDEIISEYEKQLHHLNSQ